MDRAEPNLVLGTAGHIDHGKTALIRALTGVDTDRLPEEKVRGITIELGFAPLEIGHQRVGIVDVPGHEGLVRTMVAGATGIDLVLLVVAADEGVMPQTREHVAICELLGVTRGIVALTKIDIAEEDVAELAREEVSDLIEETELAGAPIIPVSSVTGEGIEELRESLKNLIEEAPTRTTRSGPPRLSVDRSFAARGFGSIVTGTLVGGSFSVGDEVEIFPAGRTGRVRGIQNHGVDAEHGAPGMRCAINVQGIEVSQLERGCVVSHPEALIPTCTADVKLWWLSAARPTESPTSIEFLAGTAERRAQIARISAPDENQLLPGEVSFARIHIEGDPIPLLPGDRFIVRGFARTETGGTTLGGGIVLDIAPPHRRRSDPRLKADLEILARGEPIQDLGVRIERAGLTGMEQQILQLETGLERDVLQTALEQLRDAGTAAATRSHRWLSGDAVRDLERRLLDILRAYHEAEPLRPGMPTASLRGGLPDNVTRDVAELVIDGLSHSESLVVEGNAARLPDHQPTLGAEDEALVERLGEEAREAGLEPPGLRDWADRHDVPHEHFLDLLAHLERERVLVRSPGDLWFHRSSVDTLRTRVIAHLTEHGELNTQDYKALIGTTRRTAMPLMELFDTEHLTVRRDEVRVLRKASTGSDPSTLSDQ
ncbi:selenocysteine-specific translation elongation factor [Myxococcota bacterium]|nr:selenocysteine-specific translation elongation factor [Myxococcota bacterium]